MVKILFYMVLKRLIVGTDVSSKGPDSLLHKVTKQTDQFN